MKQKIGIIHSQLCRSSYNRIICDLLGKKGIIYDVKEISIPIIGTTILQIKDWCVDRAKNHTVKEQINETTDNDNTYLMGLTTIYEDGKFEYNKKGCIVTIYKNDVDETLYKELEK